MEKYTLKRHKITQISLVILLIFSLTLCFPLSVLAEDVVPDDIEDQMSGYDWTDDAKEDVWAIFGATDWNQITTMVCTADGSMAYFSEDVMQDYEDFYNIYISDIEECLTIIGKDSIYDPIAYEGIIIYAMYQMFWMCEIDGCFSIDGICLSQSSIGRFYLYDSNNSAMVNLSEGATADGITFTNEASFILHIFFGYNYNISNFSVANKTLVKEIYRRFASYETTTIAEDEYSSEIAFADIYVRTLDLAVAITSIFCPNFHNFFYENAYGNCEDSYEAFISLFDDNYYGSDYYVNDDIYNINSNYDFVYFEQIGGNIYNNYVAIKSDGHVIWAY